MPARPWLALERTRLRLHFARVRLLLRAAPASGGLCPAARARSLAQLDAYAREGRFPLHGGRGKPRPVFVDHVGTHCAVGHLLALNGHAGLVRGIRAERNHAFIPELASVPGVLPALSSLGLTAGEAALIQPTYQEGRGYGGVRLEDGGSVFSTLLLTGMLAVAIGAVVLAAGLLLSTRVRQLFWTGGFGRRVVTAVIVVLGGLAVMRGLMGLGYV